MPALSILDEALSGGTVQTDSLGLPFGRTGSFAITFKILRGSHAFALRCFLSNRPTIHQRYQAISTHLKQNPLPYLVDFSYETAGIRIKGAEYPILRMQWVDGVPLGLYVQEHHRDAQRMEDLQDRIVTMATDLEASGIAHGDLQGGNILVDTTGAITLVDYDGMFVPALASLGAIETGHPNFQHPQRERTQLFTAKADRFPLAVIYTALNAIQEDPEIWNTLNGDEEALLFRATDLRSPSQSAAFRALRELPTTRQLTERLARIASSSIDLTPSLDDFIEGCSIPEGSPLPAKSPTPKQNSANTPWYQAVPEIRQPAETTPTQRNAERVAAMSGSRSPNASGSVISNPTSPTGTITKSRKFEWVSESKGFLGVLGVLLLVGLIILGLAALGNSSSTTDRPAPDLTTQDSGAKSIEFESVDEMLELCFGTNASTSRREVMDCADPKAQWFATGSGSNWQACQSDEMVWTDWGGPGVVCLVDLEFAINLTAPTALYERLDQCWESQPTQAQIERTVDCRSLTANYQATRAAFSLQQCPSGRGLAWPNSDYYICIDPLPERSFETCMRPDGSPQICFEGLRWEYNFCWDVDSKPKLQQRIRGAWTDVTTRDFYATNNGCQPRFPWTVRFSRKATTLGVKEYRLVFPATSDFNETIQDIRVVVREVT